jgi:hypothetical protein
MGSRWQAAGVWQADEETVYDVQNPDLEQRASTRHATPTRRALPFPQHLANSYPIPHGPVADAGGWGASWRRPTCISASRPRAMKP